MYFQDYSSGIGVVALMIIAGITVLGCWIERQVRNRHNQKIVQAKACLQRRMLKRQDGSDNYPVVEI